MAFENLSKGYEVKRRGSGKDPLFFSPEEKKISKTYIISIDILLKRCIISIVRNRKTDNKLGGNRYEKHFNEIGKRL